MRREAKGQTPPTPLAFSLFWLQLSVDQSSPTEANYKIILAPLFIKGKTQSKVRRLSPAALRWVSPSHHWPRPLGVRPFDRDAALIWTDAKDLKVSFGISHHG